MNQISTHKKVVTFGEIMLRLTAPDFLRFSQTNQMIATYGGSEANVAVSLANFGIPTEFVTRLPDNAVARAVSLRSVPTAWVLTELSSEANVWDFTFWKAAPPSAIRMLFTTVRILHLLRCVPV